MLMILLMACAAFAGCLGDDDDKKDDEEEEEVDDTTVDEKPAWLDASDAGYTYASNVDNHRSLMKDLCDIKSAASSDGGYNFTEAKSIYMNGKNAEKSDGSFRTLAGFAAATGKNHGYDAFYNMDGSVGAHIMHAMDGTGDFEGASDTVRYQGIAKLTANMGMVAYTIHELNAAVAKAEAGNVDNDSGAPHNWDEGWAFFHGPDEDWSCSPAYTMKKRAADFGTETDGVSNALMTSEAAMVDGLAALQASDATGYNAAVDTVMKNVIITYSQAVLKYTYKMDSNESAAKYQAEGYAFWKTIEAYAAPYTADACYNNKTHTMSYIGVGKNASNCDSFQWYENQTMHDGSNFTGCYNMATHTVANSAVGPMGATMNETNCNEGFGAVGSTGMPMYYANYGATEIGNILDLTDASQLGTSYDVTAHLQPVWDHYGITTADIGSM